VEQETAAVTHRLSEHFTYSPDRSSSLGIDATYHWLRISISANYTGRIFRTADNTDRRWGVYQTDSLGWLTDMKIAANLPLRTSGVGNTKLALSIKNLSDEEYFEYNIGRPRAYYLEGSVKF
jgi:hypothetical protein